MRVRFFPCDAECKNPVGGVEINKDFTLNLFVIGADSSVTVLTKDGEQPVKYPMERKEYGFSLTMRVTTPGLYFYRFEISSCGKTVSYYADEDLNAAEGEGRPWQLTAFEKIYRAPDFLDGGIYYQIFPDRFNIGGLRLKTKAAATYRDDWGGCPEFEADADGIVRNNDMFGGNLDGITEKLDYLSSLSVRCIYLNPIFEAASNHKYDTGSYRRVDGDFGGIKALERLFSEADKRGIKVILDGVFSHTGADSVYFNRYGSYDSAGAYQSKNSPYYGWYDFTEYPDNYACWWGVKILPCVKESDPVFDEFINGEDGVIRTYMRMGAAGWRLDVADELPDGFLDRLTHAAKSVNENAVVLGEVWEDASNKTSYGRRRRYLTGRQLDSVTNYPFKDAVIDFIKTGRAENIARTVNAIVNNYPPDALKNLMNPLSTHDTVRILTALSDCPLPGLKRDRADYAIPDLSLALKRLRAAAALQYTLPGVPCIYYGDETGMEGCEDPFNRRCYPWGKENSALIQYYRALGRLRRAPELNGGDFSVLRAGGGIFSFVRGGKLVVVCNAGNADYALDEKVTDLIEGKEFSSVPPLTAVVYRAR